jgi:putative ABC transport system permease protein
VARLSSLFRNLLYRKRIERELDEELRATFEMLLEEKVRSGMPPEEARRAARLELGSHESLKDGVRDVRVGAGVDAVFQDIRYALRQLRHSPGFTAVAVATLALGIGVNSAMFSAVDAVLIRPLPYADADRLVMIWADPQRTGGGGYMPTPPEWREWRRLNTVFTDIAATDPGHVTLSGDGEPEEVPGRRATGNLWTVLGAQPLLGRCFTEEDDAQGARVAVISHGLWQRRFGGSLGVLGRTIHLNDQPYEVIGVMPPQFYFLPARDIDIWTPTSWSAAQLRQFFRHDLWVVARLRPGVTLAQAREEMSALSLRVTAHLPRPRSAAVMPLREELAGKTRTSLIVLLCASAAVLLVACVNLANLLLSRGAARHHEIAVRAALGAGRRRLIRQFLTESLVLAFLGALAGLALALPALQYLQTLVPETMAGVSLTLDGRVLMFSTVVAAAAALTFGLLPALGGSRVSLQGGLREAARGSAGARSHWFQHSLIVVETALAVVLLASGGLLLQTFQHLRQLDLGIRPEKLLTFVTPLFRYREFDSRVAFVNAELEKVRAIPGVVNAGAISRIPLTVNDQATFYLLAGQPDEDAREQVALSRVVTLDYFATVGAGLREGRFFDRADRRSDAPVVVVNESFADRNYPGRSPLGARFKFGDWGSKAYWYTIVGVVKEIRDRGVAEELQGAVYRLHEQADQSVDQPSGIVVRTSVDPASIVPAVRQAIWSVDPNEPVARVQTIEDIVARQLSTPAQSTALLGAFALLALFLASIGLYGVISYAVTRRTSEIGVRIALGATSRDILLSFGRRGLALALAGLAIGLVLASVAARLMTALFYGFAPDYVSAIAGVSVTLLAVAMVACLVPARRASRIDPLAALQHE